LATYSIRDLQKLSGIKAHTIRIWEQRYNIIEPKRTPSNIRYYTEEDLKYLMNIAFLNRKGIRISKIAKMSKEELATRIAELSKTDVEETDHFQGLAMAMIELNEAKVCKLLSAIFEQLGAEKTILEILDPFLQKVSMLWLTGSISAVHEQFVSALIRRKVLAAINELPIKKKNKGRIMLFLPEFEQQEVYLIFVEYLLKKMNFEVVYLGCKIPIDDIKLACTLRNPDYIYTIVSEKHKRYVPADYVEELCETIAPTQLLVAGYQQFDKKLDANNVTQLEDLHELVDFFQKV